jgi:hypothetical protein
MDVRTFVSLVLRASENKPCEKGCAMNRWTKVFFAVTLLFAWAVDGSCATADMSGLIRGTLKAIRAQKGDFNLCVLTDSTYVNLAGRSTEEYVDMVQRETGCSVGKGNLLLFHRPSNYDLIIALYKRDTKECVVIRHDGQEGRVGKLHIGDEHISGGSLRFSQMRGDPWSCLSRTCVGLFHSQGHPEAVSLEERREVRLHSLSKRVQR